MAKRGPPSLYTPELAELICKRLAAGESLNAICKDSGMPHESTVRSWALDDVDGFATKYARARDLQADLHADEIVGIADTEEDPQRAKVRIDARKWIAAKVLPKKYGERQAIEHTGEGGGPIVIKTYAPRGDDQPGS